ncbi:hypothetical protein C0993_012027 [Termitomyces sp. T159_Od127]|nr:hypothetical protein C0993_012027 [Termitomyces sp. T159_Od127]
MSLDLSCQYPIPHSWSTAALRDAVKQATEDAQNSPLPRALSVDKIFGPLVRAIQYDQYRHVSQGFCPVSFNLLVSDLSLNYVMFRRGDFATGVTEKELAMIALFKALERDEICEDEVLGLAKCVITPSFRAVAEEVPKIHLSTDQLEEHNLSSSRQEQCNSFSINSLMSQEVFLSTLPKPYLFEITDSRPSIPTLGSTAFASFSEDQNPQPFLSNTLIIQTEPQDPLSPIHMAWKASVPFSSTPKSPILGVSRSPNVPLTPSPNVISSKYLGTKRKTIALMRRSNMANKENIPPKNRH